MKRNKFKEFLNSRGQYAAVFAFIVVAGICAGAAALNGPQEETAIETEPVSYTHLVERTCAENNRG